MNKESIKKLDSVKLSFGFEDQEEQFDLNFDVSIKTNTSNNHIKILDRKIKRKNTDASTKLF